MVTLLFVVAPGVAEHPQAPRRPLQRPLQPRGKRGAQGRGAAGGAGAVGHGRPLPKRLWRLVPWRKGRVGNSWDGFCLENIWQNIWFCYLMFQKLGVEIGIRLEE